MFFPRINPLIYFDKKLKGYYVIGDVHTIENTLYLNEDKKDATAVRLYLAKVYAGTAEYFKSQEVPLSHREYKHKFFKSFPVFVPIQPLKEITDKKYEYIGNSIKQKKEHFLVALACGISKALPQNKNKQKYIPTDFFWAILPIIKEEFEIPLKNHSYGRFYNHFNYILWKFIISEENELLMTNDAFHHALYMSAYCIYKLKNKTKLLNSDLKKINELISNIPARNNPLIDFTYSFLDSFLEYLQKKKLLKICPTCNKVFKYKYNQTYCSYKCAKHKHHLRYYPKHRIEILPKARKRMRELRAYYKGYSVKK